MIEKTEFLAWMVVVALVAFIAGGVFVASSTARISANMTTSYEGKCYQLKELEPK